MVSVRYQGRLGNQLFQYCLGRILAEAKGLALDAPAIDGFPATAEPVAGRRVRFPWRTLRGHDVNLAATLADGRARHLRLRGYFQNWGYYAEHAARIRGWLGYEPARDLGVGPRDALVMVRLTDYQRCGGMLGWAYYEAVLRQLRYDRLFVTSDDLDHPMIARLGARFGARPLQAGALATMRLGAAFSTVVMSNSTYAWWLAFLGRAEEIWFPVPSHVGEGCWALNRLVNGVDLRIDDPRYRYVYRVPTTDERRAGRPAELTRLDAAAGANDLLRPSLARARAFHLRSAAYVLTSGIESHSGAIALANAAPSTRTTSTPVALS